MTSRRVQLVGMIVALIVFCSMVVVTAYEFDFDFETETCGDLLKKLVDVEVSPVRLTATRGTQNYDVVGRELYAVPGSPGVFVTYSSAIPVQSSWTLEEALSENTLTSTGHAVTRDFDQYYRDFSFSMMFRTIGGFSDTQTMGEFSFLYNSWIGKYTDFRDLSLAGGCWDWCDGGQLAKAATEARNYASSYWSGMRSRSAGVTRGYSVYSRQLPSAVTLPYFAMHDFAISVNPDATGLKLGLMTGYSKQIKVESVDWGKVESLQTPEFSGYDRIGQGQFAPSYAGTVASRASAPGDFTYHWRTTGLSCGINRYTRNFYPGPVYYKGTVPAETVSVPFTEPTVIPPVASETGSTRLNPLTVTSPLVSDVPGELFLSVEDLSSSSVYQLGGKLSPEVYRQLEGWQWNIWRSDISDCCACMNQWDQGSAEYNYPYTISLQSSQYFPGDADSQPGFPCRAVRQHSLSHVYIIYSLKIRVYIFIETGV